MGNTKCLLFTSSYFVEAFAFIYHVMVISFSIFQEVLVRFAGFGPEEDEWINIRKHVRPRSLPCESSECVVVIPGDLILCFQVGIAVARCHKKLILIINIVFI